MRRIFAICAFLAFGSGGCVTTDGPAPAVSSARSRELSASEQADLGHKISLTMKDPDAAKFFWLPVVLYTRPDGIVDYCAFLNGKNSYGGYAGFQPFYAQLVANKEGVFDFIELRLTGSDDVNFGAVRSICARAGYARFGGPK